MPVNLQKTVTRVLAGALAPLNLGTGAEIQCEAGKCYEIRSADAPVAVRDGAPPLSDRDVVMEAEALCVTGAQTCVIRLAAYGAAPARVYVSEIVEVR